MGGANTLPATIALVVVNYSEPSRLLASISLLFHERVMLVNHREMLFFKETSLELGNKNPESYWSQLFEDRLKGLLRRRLSRLFGCRVRHDSQLSPWYIPRVLYPLGYIWLELRLLSKEFSKGSRIKPHL